MPHCEPGVAAKTAPDIPSATSSTRSRAHVGVVVVGEGRLQLQRGALGRGRPPELQQGGAARPVAVLREGALLDGELVGTELAVPAHLVDGGLARPCLEVDDPHPARGIHLDPVDLAGDDGAPQGHSDALLGGGLAPSCRVGLAQVAGQPGGHRLGPAEVAAAQPAGCQPEPPPA